MRFIRHGLLVVGLFLMVGCGAGLVTETIVPEYVIDAKALLGTGRKESQPKLLAMSDFRLGMMAISHYAKPDREYGRVAPYFKEAQYSPDSTYVLPGDKARLTLSITRGKVGRVELTHVGIVSAEEAVMMLGYDPKKLIEHPLKHRNAERSDWFALIDPYFHIIEIQWFDATKLGKVIKSGKVTQIRVSVW